jgi:hypothetical protein
MPLNCINLNTTLFLFNYSNTNSTAPANIVSGMHYRMQSFNCWAAILCENLVLKLPLWTCPYAQFKIEGVASTYDAPQLRALRAGEQKCTMANFVYQVIKQSSARAILEKPQDAHYQKVFDKFTIVEDPAWQTGNFNCTIIYTSK